MLCAIHTNDYSVNSHLEILNPPANVDSVFKDYLAVGTFTGGFRYTQALLQAVGHLIPRLHQVILL